MGCNDSELFESLQNYKGYVISEKDKETGVIILEKDRKMTYVMTTEYYMNKYSLGDTIK